jgi:hypothetical protein
VNERSHIPADHPGEPARLTRKLTSSSPGWLRTDHGAGEPTKRLPRSASDQAGAASLRRNFTASFQAPAASPTTNTVSTMSNTTSERLMTPVGADRPEAGDQPHERDPRQRQPAHPSEDSRDGWT